MTVGPHDLLYVPAGMCFAERVAVASGDVFGLRVPVIAVSGGTIQSVIKPLRDSYTARVNGLAAVGGSDAASSEMADRYASVYALAQDALVGLEGAREQEAKAVDEKDQEAKGEKEKADDKDEEAKGEKAKADDSADK